MKITRQGQVVIEGLAVLILVVIPTLFLVGRYLVLHWRDLHCEITAFDRAHAALVEDVDSQSNSVTATVTCGPFTKEVTLWKLHALE